jgi:hypothetical protein
MASYESEVYGAETQRLAKLLALEEADTAPWSRKELAKVLFHQLKSPLRLGVVSSGPRLGVALPELNAQECAAFNTFEEVLDHPHPPVELLRLIKEFAKAHFENSQPHLPREIAGVLYITSIAVALAKCSQRITQLDDPSLRRGIAWALEQAWVADRCKVMLTDALKCLPTE